MSPKQDLTVADAEAFRVLEERLAMPASTESRETLAALLAEGFEEFGSSGRVFDIEAVLEALLVPGGRPRIQLDDFTATVVTAGVVLVRYVSRSVAGAGWKPPARRSSLWCYREGRWQMLFHQGTCLPEGKTRNGILCTARAIDRGCDPRRSPSSAGQYSMDPRREN